MPTSSSRLQTDTPAQTGTSIGTSVTTISAENLPSSFPTDSLPPILKAMALAISQTSGAPPALPACCILGVVSASLGRGLQVQSGPNRITRGNLFLMPSAESGSAKSESFRPAVQPLQAYEKALRVRWDEVEAPALEAKKELLGLEIKSVLKLAGRDTENRAQLSQRLQILKRELARLKKIAPPVLCVEDVTTERLATLLEHTGGVLASFSSDAGSVVNNLLGRYNRSGRPDESLYLKAFSGERCRFDRQSRDEVTLDDPCLTGLWLVQPDKLEALQAKESLMDGGLVQRLLICHTDCAPQPIAPDQAAMPANTVRAYKILIRSLLDTFRMIPEIDTIKPTPTAKNLMDGHYNQTIARLRTDLRDIRTFASRWTEQAWRLSVVLHAGLHGNEAHDQELSETTAKAAITIVNWFAEEQLRMLAASREMRRKNLHNAILKLFERGANDISNRDVHRARIVRTAEQARLLLSEMEAERLLIKREHRPEGGGHLTHFYRLP